MAEIDPGFVPLGRKGLWREEGGAKHSGQRSSFFAGGCARNASPVRKDAGGNARGAWPSGEIPAGFAKYFSPAFVSLI